jgi:hypothetical protein
MKRRLLGSKTLRPRKNDLRISFITNDLGSAYTLPTPQNTLCLGGAHDA